MKNALLKDTLREIQKTFSRFLSIFAIVALGVSFFAGIKAACPDMKITADTYFDEYRLMDIRLVSTIGFNDEDVKAVKSTSGVEGVFPTYSMDAIVSIQKKDVVFKVLSLPMNKLYNPDESYINRVRLISGRFPQKENECVIESENISPNLNIGSKIKLESGTDWNISQSLKVSEYTITGIVESPYYISFERGTSSIGNGKVHCFILVPQNNFRLPLYTDVFVTVKGARDAQSYDDIYETIVDPVKEALEDVGEDRVKKRNDEILYYAYKELNNQKWQLDMTQRKQNKEINTADLALLESKLQIISANMSLSSGEDEFYNTMRAAEDSINDGFRKLEENERELNKNLQSINSAMKRASETELQQYKAMESQLNAAKASLEVSRQRLESEKRGLEAYKKSILDDFISNRTMIDNSIEDIIRGNLDIKAGKKLSDIKFHQANQQIKTAEEELEEMEEPEWYVLDRDTNPGFAEYGSAADRMDAIAAVFPVFFFLIAALVCLTTMTRMIDEQRTYIGTLKALGYNKLSIASKYLLYAAVASIGGSILGLLVGFNLFPTIIFNAYGAMYSLPPIITEFNVEYAALSMAAAVLTTTLAAFFSCNKELLMTPALLMRPKAPKAGKRILLERITFIWSRFNFTHKITARNMFRYKKRFFMTVIGISGCTALLVTGYGLRDSILSISQKQYGEIYHYDLSVNLKESYKTDETPEILTDIAKDNRITDYILLNEQNVDAGTELTEKAASLIVSKNTTKLQDFITFRVRTTGEKLELDDKGVIITEKLAKLLNVAVGDTIYLTDEDDNKVYVKITGITEHFVFHYIYMTPELYNSLFEDEIEFNQVKAVIADGSKEFENTLSTDLIKDSEVSSITLSSNTMATLSDIVESLDFIIIVLIASAGALAFVVLYNLTNINITERLREIATIKVLGFYDNEVSAYVYRENAILTVIGIFAGLVLGIFLHKFIILTAEIESLMFGREIKIPSYIYSAILTAVFAALVNTVMYFKLKKITMVESLKSVD
ncbi:ABC transporter permease [Oxobacter pfennigii]|nr:ABC transporter permease [Oxobacter pfennigii]